jgi:hypothetical protein
LTCRVSRADGQSQPSAGTGDVCAVRFRAERLGGRAAAGVSTGGPSQRHHRRPAAHLALPDHRNRSPARRATPPADSWQPCRNNEGAPAGDLSAACSVSLRVEPRMGCERAWPTIKRSRRSRARDDAAPVGPGLSEAPRDLRRRNQRSIRQRHLHDPQGIIECMVVDLVAAELGRVHKRIARILRSRAR